MRRLETSAATAVSIAHEFPVTQFPSDGTYPTCSAPVGGGCVIATTSSAIRITPGTNVTATGFSPSTFNTANNVVATVDYPNQLIMYYSSTAAAGSATGGTISGLSDDGFETDNVECSNGTANAGYSCSAGQITIVPTHTYASTDKWGLVTMAVVRGDGEGGTGVVTNNISFSGGPGAQFFDPNGIHETFTNDSFTPYYSSPNSNGISVGFVGYNMSWNTFNNTAFEAWNTGWNSCAAGGCNTTSYPYGMELGSLSSYYGAYGNGTGSMVKLQEFSTLRGGIKVDGNGQSAVCLTGPDLDRGFTEELVWGDIVFDTRNKICGTSSGGLLRLRDWFSQDLAQGSLDFGIIAFTDPTTSVLSYPANLDDFRIPQLSTLGNTYFTGYSVDSSGSLTQMGFPWPANPSFPLGTFHANGVTRTEFEGQGFQGLEAVPFGTLAATQTSSGVAAICTSGCTVTAVNDPFGNQNAFDLQGNSGTTNPQIGVVSIATYPGDSFILSDFIKPGLGVNTAATTGPNVPIHLESGIGQTEGWQSNCNANVFEGCITNYGFWSPINTDWTQAVGLITITGGSTSPHNVSLHITSGSATGLGIEHYCPQWVFIPGPNNPSYAGVTSHDAQIARMYQYLIDCAAGACR